MKKQLLAPILIVTSILSACSNNNQEKASADTTLKTDTNIIKNENAVSLDTTDVSFFKNAAYGGMTEVEGSNKILQLTTDTAIKTFAKMMVDDHTQANEALKSLATSKGYTLPIALPESKLAVLKKMDTFKDEGRDEYYVKLMIAEHKNAINIFSLAGRSKDAEISKFATSILPKLNHHYQHILKLDTAQQAPKANQGDDPLKISDRKKQQP